MNQTSGETFKEPFLEKIKRALDHAVSITCADHRIYVCLDQETHQDQKDLGYEMVIVSDKQAALDQLYKWFEASGSLRFISTIERKEIHRTLIGQCEYDDEEEED